MPYKTVLVHVDESARASERIKIAAAIAMAEGAHLIGTAMTGASRYLVQTRMLAELDPNLKTHLDFLRERAMRGLDDFEATAQKLGLPSFEKRLVDDEAGGGICLQARYADLVVIGQNDPYEISPVVMPDFPEYVVLYSGRPVLLVPFSGHHDVIGKRVLIAWDASMPATRAVTNAIPLLRRAHIVQVAVFNSEVKTGTKSDTKSGTKSGPKSAGTKSADTESDNRRQAHGAMPGSDIALYLARHDVKVEVLQRKTGHDIGEALLALAADLQSDLIVMGGYGHTRFREILLGGVTSTVLETMTVPVLMAH